MITARKSWWFERVFAAYNRNLLARRFEGLRIRGLENLQDRRRDAPLVLYANHSSWWDGLLIFHAGRICGLEQYAMMEERQLRQYPFHRKLGAFSVVREDPRKALESILYASDLLRGSSRALWIFPQGTIEHNDIRPLKLYTGAARIIKRVGAAYTAPVALRYEFLDDFRPEALMRVEEPERVEAMPGFNAKQLTETFSQRLTEALDALRADVFAKNLSAYAEVVAPGRRRRV